MSAFDDLIPGGNGGTPAEASTKTGGAFDDLIPTGSERKAAPNAGRSRFEDVGAGSSALEGYLAGVTGNLRDEVYGLSEASGLPHVLGGFRAPVGAVQRLLGLEGAEEAYERARDEKRAEIEQAKSQNPGMFTAGQIGGAIALPGGAMMRAPTMAARAARGAGLGGAYGAVSGFGEGEGAAESLTGAASGGAAGAVLGAAGVPVIEGLAKGAGAALSYPINLARSAINPEAAASRAVGRAATEAARADPGALNRLDMGDLAPGGPAAVMDVLGQPGRNLARSSANISGEARDTLNQTLDPRLAGQGPRLVDWLNNSFNFPDARVRQKAIESTARGANSAAYQRAYQEGAGGLWGPDLERLASSEAVSEAMKKAIKSVQDEAVLAGQGGFNPKISFTSDGRIQFNKGPGGVPTYPDLQYWDQVRRELSDAAKRAGRGTEEARRLGGFASSLNSILDKMVPSYKAARQTAAGFFGAKNALEAGEKFATQKFDLSDTKSALAKMSPNERKLFQDGFVSKMGEIVNSLPDRRDIVNIIANNPAAKEKIQLTLGMQKARELEVILRAENIMQQSLKAVQGNSTTAMQIIGAGLAGGAGGGFLGFDPSTSGIASALATAGKKGIDHRVATKIAKMLTSRDPDVIRRGVQMIATSKRGMTALRATDAAVTRAGAQQTVNITGPQAAGVGRAEDE